MEPLWDSKKITEYLGIDYKTYLKIIREDQAFPARKVGGSWKADPEELRDWFRDQGKQVNNGNVVEINKPLRGRPPLSGTRPRTKAK